MRTLLFTIIALLVGFASAGEEMEARKVERKGPLANLPSEPGAHIARIKAMKDNSWLDLGEPAADVKYGRKARGRSYTPRMPYAPKLRGAFLTGEGKHGWYNKETNIYMDGVWFYDINAHRWICIYPGTDTKKVSLRLNSEGFEVDEKGEYVPVAPLVHGNEHVTYDRYLQQFTFVPWPKPYWKQSMGERRLKWLNRRTTPADRGVHPAIYDVMTGKWDRRLSKGDVLVSRSERPGPYVYLPEKKKAMIPQGAWIWLYDLATNSWSKLAADGPAWPFNHSVVLCHDPVHKRVYTLGTIKVPDSEMWYYDIEKNLWVNSRAKHLEFKVAVPYMTKTAGMTYDTANDVIVVKHVKDGKRVLFIFDADKNQWKPQVLDFPLEIDKYAVINAFYDPVLNVHFFHAAPDSGLGGRMWAYRYKQAKKGRAK